MYKIKCIVTYLYSVISMLFPVITYVSAAIIADGWSSSTITFSLQVTQKTAHTHSRWDQCGVLGYWPGWTRCLVCKASSAWLWWRNSMAAVSQCPAWKICHRQGSRSRVAAGEQSGVSCPHLPPQNWPLTSHQTWWCEVWGCKIS